MKLTITNSTSSYPPETYTPEETSKLAEFRALVSDLNLSEEWLEDANLIRWLRARDLNLKKSYEMLKTSLEWRKEFEIDGIDGREEIPEDYQMQMFTGAYIGDDKAGFPIILVPCGASDFIHILEKYGSEACFRYHFNFMEKWMKLLREIGTRQGRAPVTQYIQIMDMEGYSFRQFYSGKVRDFMGRMQKAMDLNYPEILRYCLVINAPKMFHLIFQFFKPFMSKKTLDKFEILGGDKNDWRKVMSERIPMELVPPHWGGTRGALKDREEDPFCLEDGIWLCKPAILRVIKALWDKEEEVVTIGARDQLKIPLTVKLPSEISYQLRPHSHDIGFKIVQEMNEEKEKEVVPFKKVQAQKKGGMEEGKVKCGVGKYCVVFDNSYSYVRSKTISYSVKVVEEENIENLDEKEKINV